MKPAPKVGQVFTTQLNDNLGMAVRVDNKPNGNLAIQYLKITENGDGTYTTSLEMAWTTWYLPKYENPKYGKVADLSNYETHINDTHECTCRECDNYFEVDGFRDQETETNDHFNGSHYQTESYYDTFKSVWACPTCGTINKEDYASEIE
jgi:hypothetical protein